MITRIIRNALPVTALLLSLPSFAYVQAQSVLRGKVLTSGDKTGIGAVVSRFWVLGTSDENGAKAYSGVSADASGQFALPIASEDLPVDLLVFAADRKSAAVVNVTTLDRPITIQLQPTEQVRVIAEAPSVGKELSGTRFLLQSLSGATLGQLFGNDVAFPFPSGEYQLSLSSAETIGVTKSVHLTSGKPVALKFDLALSPMASHFGQLPPTLRGLVDIQARPIAMPQFDRPTLLYFWADWCQPCVAEGIPHLLQFAAQHKGERFRIIAIHENGIPKPSTTAMFQRSLKSLQASVWRQKLLFPFVFDASGSVTRGWGLSTFPTYALVDAQGRLQRKAGLEELQKLIKP